MFSEEENKNSHNEKINLISIQEPDIALKQLNNKTSSGMDGVSNLMLKKTSPQLRNILLNLFNKTLIESKIPAEWKR
jgi:hypothetical protein